MKRILIAALCSFAVLGGSAAALSTASEQTRETYKSAVEPICEANASASDRYLKGVKGLVKQDKLVKASQNFAKAATALEKARTQLATVAPPAEDAARISKWLAGIKGEIALMRQISAKLAKGQKGPASSLSVKLQHNATATNNVVIVFQFDACKIDPSRYA